MRIDVLTLFPQMFDALRVGGIPARAMDAGLLQIHCWNPRDYAKDKHRTVDDRPYGGGPGMLMQVQPLLDALNAARAANGQLKAKTIFLSPQGKPLTQSSLQSLSQQEALILVAGRYEGVDERFIEQEIDEEYSLGDYVLSGGELPAMVLIDGVSRLLPGALGHDQSAAQDSFMKGLLDCPHYTRPETLNGRKVPPVLLSGDHQAIARWREKQALGRTWQRRPDLLQAMQLSEHQQQLLQEFIGEQKNVDSDATAEHSE